MYKMRLLYFTLIILVSAYCIPKQSDSLISERLKTLSMSLKKYRKVRCTRRFTVGSCFQCVKPVWTFVAPLQTCTERLGCPSGTFANRFDSLEDCLETCRDLIYLFMYLQSGDNGTFVIPDTGVEEDLRRFDDRGSPYGDYVNPYPEDTSSDEYADDTHPNIDGYRRQNLDELIRAELSGASPDYPEPLAQRRSNPRHQKLERTPDIDHF